MLRGVVFAAVAATGLLQGQPPPDPSLVGTSVISGRVVDATSGRAVAGARVQSLRDGARGPSAEMPGDPGLGADGPSSTYLMDPAGKSRGDHSGYRSGRSA
jgi:hypothetical protein